LPRSWAVGAAFNISGNFLIEVFVEGNVQGGMAMIRQASKTIVTVAEGAKVSQKVLTAMKYLRSAAKVLTVIAVILEGVLLIYEAIEGARQRTELQKCVTSFSIVYFRRN
jgi:hypothetical protein